ncbi:MAG: thiazole synthase [Bacteroidetes bacterium]|nr:thiazole synthase [Bacteroidota bacterium]
MENSLLPEPDSWTLGGRTFRSRLLLGTAGYSSPALLFKAVQAAGTEIVTLSVRRIQVARREDTFLDEPLMHRMQLLPNTAGCYTAQDAILTAQLAREALETNWIKVEVIGDEHTLLPDPLELLKACTELVKQGFVVLPYCPDDPILCKRLEEAGCVAVMPLAAPIGSGLGIRNPHNLELIRGLVKVPVIVDAGIGTASDAALALELGCDAVLLNTAVSQAVNPPQMAAAMRYAVVAGRLAYQAGRIPRIHHGRASTPLEGRIGT